MSKPILIYCPLGLVHMQNLRVLSSILKDFHFRILFQKCQWFTPEYASSCEYQNIFIEDSCPPGTLFLGNVRGVILTNAQACPLNLNIIEAARDLGIPILAIEEVVQCALNDGKINSYLLPVDHLLLASLQECLEFEKFGVSSKRLNDVGWAFEQNVRAEDREMIRSDFRRRWVIPKEKRVATLFLSQLNSTETRGSLEMPFVRSQILELVKKGLPESYHLVIKLHPIEHYSEAKSSIDPYFPHVTIVGVECTAAEVLTVTDVCLNRGNSQVIIEAMLQNIPVIALPCGLRTIFDEQMPEVVISDPLSLYDLLERFRLGEIPDLRRIINIHYPRPASAALMRMSALIREVAVSQRKNVLPEDWLDISLYWGILGNRIQGKSALAKYEVAGGSAFLATIVRKLLCGSTRTKSLCDFIQHNENVGYRLPLAITLWVMNQSYLRRQSIKKLKELLKIIEKCGGYPPPFNPHMFLSPALRLGEIMASHGLIEEARVMAYRMSNLFFVERLKTDLLESIELGKYGFYRNLFRHVEKRISRFTRVFLTFCKFKFSD